MSEFEKARAGLTLLASKENPRVKRWQGKGPEKPGEEKGEDKPGGGEKPNGHAEHIKKLQSHYDDMKASGVDPKLLEDVKSVIDQWGQGGVTTSEKKEPAPEKKPGEDAGFDLTDEEAKKISGLGGKPDELEWLKKHPHMARHIIKLGEEKEKEKVKEPEAEYGKKEEEKPAEKKKGDRGALIPKKEKPEEAKKEGEFGEAVAGAEKKTLPKKGEVVKERSKGSKTAQKLGDVVPGEAEQKAIMESIDGVLKAKENISRLEEEITQAKNLVEGDMAVLRPTFAKLDNQREEMGKFKSVLETPDGRKIVYDNYTQESTEWHKMFEELFKMSTAATQAAITDIVAANKKVSVREKMYAAKAIFDMLDAMEKAGIVPKKKPGTQLPADSDSGDDQRNKTKGDKPALNYRKTVHEHFGDGGKKPEGKGNGSPDFESDKSGDILMDKNPQQPQAQTPPQQNATPPPQGQPTPPPQGQPTQDQNGNDESAQGVVMGFQKLAAIGQREIEALRPLFVGTDAEYKGEEEPDAQGQSQPQPQPQQSSNQVMRKAVFDLMKARFVDLVKALAHKQSWGVRGRTKYYTAHRQKALIPTVGSKKEAYGETSGSWHSRTMEKMKTLDEGALRFIIKDATEAAELGEKIGNPKSGQYRDEVHYAVMELNRRKKGVKLVDAAVLEPSLLYGGEAGKKWGELKDVLRAKVKAGELKSPRDIEQERKRLQSLKPEEFERVRSALVAPTEGVAEPAGGYGTSLHKRIKTITSHVGLARFLDEAPDAGFYIARDENIPSPYAYSPTHTVYAWKGKNVIVVETSHKRYEVFEVSPATPRLPRDIAASGEPESEDIEEQYKVKFTEREKAVIRDEGYEAPDKVPYSERGSDFSEIIDTATDRNKLQSVGEQEKPYGGDTKREALTILDQMGGVRQLTMMTGAKNFIRGHDGGKTWLSFEFPNRGQSKPNYVKVTLEPDDTYTMEFGRKKAITFGRLSQKEGVSGSMDDKAFRDQFYSKLGEFNQVYNEDLKDLFEHQTGLYLTLKAEDFEDSGLEKSKGPWKKGKKTPAEQEKILGEMKRIVTTHPNWESYHESQKGKTYKDFMGRTQTIGDADHDRRNSRSYYESAQHWTSKMEKAEMMADPRIDRALRRLKDPDSETKRPHWYSDPGTEEDSGVQERRKYEKEEERKQSWTGKTRGGKLITYHRRKALAARGKVEEPKQSYGEGAGKPPDRNSAEWASYAAEQNRKFHIAQEEKFVSKWKSGEAIAGNDIVNMLRSKGIDIPKPIKRALQDQETTVSTTSVVGRGMHREAKKIHKFVSLAMFRYEAPGTGVGLEKAGDIGVGAFLKEEKREPEKAEKRFFNWAQLRDNRKDDELYGKEPSDGKRRVAKSYFEKGGPGSGRKKGRVSASAYELKVAHFQHNKGLDQGLAHRAAKKHFMDSGYDYPKHWAEELAPKRKLVEKSEAEFGRKGGGSPVSSKDFGGDKRQAKRDQRGEKSAGVSAMIGSPNAAGQS